MADSHLGVGGEHAGQAEVPQLDVALSVQEDVCALEVAVQDPVLVQVVHGKRDLPKVPQHLPAAAGGPWG